MKFGKDLEQTMQQRWKGNYIDYEGLKSILKDEGKTVEERVALFEPMLTNELLKVNRFYSEKVEEFTTQLKQRRSSVDNSEGESASSVRYEIFRDMGDLQTFVYLNSEGFKKIMKKYDKKLGFRGTDQQKSITFATDVLSRQPFCGPGLEAVVTMLRDLNRRGHSSTHMQMKIVSGTGNRELAQEISGRVGLPLTPVMVKKFADGEIFVQILENVRNSDVFVIQPTCQPVNDNLIELLLMVAALRRASAARVTAVIPYYGYARQDRKDRPRVTISAADVARMIEAMGVDRVACVDLHCGQIQGFFGPTTPVDNLFAGPIALQYIVSKKLVTPVVVSPDAGGVQRAKAFKDGLDNRGLDVSMAMIIKQRKAAGVIGQMDLVGSVAGCDCVIVDDMIDTAGTLCTAAGELRRMGALRIFAFATHGLFNGPAADRIEASVLEEVLTANTVPLRAETAAKTSKIKQLSVGKLLSATIQCIHYGESIAKLFEADAAAATLSSPSPLPPSPAKPSA